MSDRIPVLVAAVAWWKRQRPLSYDEADHIKHPTVNCKGKEEHELAIAVADYIRGESK